MTSLRLGACIAGSLLLAVSAGAQQRPVDRNEIVVTNAPETSGPGAPVLNPVSAGTPLQLRGNAVPTGLSGYYDYQSNGMSPGYIVVSPANPNHIHTSTMLGTDTSSTDAISASRRVGYAYSSDGGATWKSTKAIDNIKLGYPYLQLLPDNTVIIGTHGDVSGLRTLFYVSPSEGDLTFFQLGGTEQASSLGAVEGMIWPSFVIDPTPPMKAVVIASLFISGSAAAAPLEVTTFDIDKAVAEPWRQIAEDPTVSTSNGGRYVMARSAGGKIGVAYMHYPNVAGDLETPGIWLTESTDGGTTWSSPERVLGYTFTDEYMLNGDQDTIVVGPNVDLVYRGEDAHVVTDGSAPLYASQGLYHWSRETGMQRIVVSDSTIGLGLHTYPNALGNTKVQANMAYISYPTLTAGKTGNNIVVAFQAVAQMSTDVPAVMSEQSFNYYRIWGIASRDGGRNWGAPFLIQDFAGEGSDSANLDYPSAAEISQVDASGNLQLDLTFQARRYPGMYAFPAAFTDGTTADAGPINEAFQYFQRFTVTPEMMGAPASVGTTTGSHTAGSIRVYPSQASTSATVDYTLATSGMISIRLYNALGAEVMTVTDGATAGAGHYTKSIDLSAIPAGVYRCVLMQNGASVSAPVVVVR